MAVTKKEPDNVLCFVKQLIDKNSYFTTILTFKYLSKDQKVSMEKVTLDNDDRYF